MQVKKISVLMVFVLLTLLFAPCVVPSEAEPIGSIDELEQVDLLDEPEQTNLFSETSQELLAEYDFDSGSQGWTVLSGSWSATGGVYKKSPISGTAQTYTSSEASADWTDYSVEADIKITDIGTTSYSLGIYTGYQNAQNIYGFEYAVNASTGSHSVRANKYVNSYTSTNIASANIGIPNLALNTVHKFKAVMSRGKLELWIDDEKLLTCSDSTFTKGRVGLYAWNCAVEFDNVSIYTAEPGPDPSPSPSPSIEPSPSVSPIPSVSPSPSVSPAPSPSSNPSVLARYDFESGSTGWTSATGSWTAAGGVYKQESISITSQTSAGSTEWADYSVEAKIKITSTGTAAYSVGIFTGYRDLQHLYGLEYSANATTNASSAKAIKHEGSDANTSIGASEAVPLLSLNTVYNFKAIMNQGTLELWINGVKVVTRNDTTFTKGKIGLYTWNCAAEFDNVYVTSIAKLKASGQVSYDIPAFSGLEIPVRFNYDMDTSTINTSNITVYDQNGNQIPSEKIDITFENDSLKQISIIFNDWLEYKTKYEIRFGDGLSLATDKVVERNLQPLGFTTMYEPYLPLSVLSAKFEKKLSGGDYKDLEQADLEAGGTVRVTVSIRTVVRKDVNVTVIGAACSGNDDYYSVAAVGKDTGAVNDIDMFHDLSFEMDVPAGLVNPSIELFFWDNLTNPKRVAENVSFKQ